MKMTYWGNWRPSGESFEIRKKKALETLEEIELDEGMKPLVDRINASEWLHTKACCSGHGNRSGYVMFDVHPDRMDAYDEYLRENPVRTETMHHGKVLTIVPANDEIGPQRLVVRFNDMDEAETLVTDLVEAVEKGK